MASTTTWKYGPKISLSHVTMKGGGGPDPFIVKDYEKGPFFCSLPLPFLAVNDNFLGQFLLSVDELSIWRKRAHFWGIIYHLLGSVITLLHCVKSTKRSWYMSDPPPQCGENTGSVVAMLRGKLSESEESYQILASPFLIRSSLYLYIFLIFLITFLITFLSFPYNFPHFSSFILITFLISFHIFPHNFLRCSS